MAAFMRGTVSLRDQVLPLVDLRLWLGLTSARDDIRKLQEELRQREEDHRQWLNALEQSIVAGVPFTKARDPHQCAFGRWYDNFTIDNIQVRSCLRTFDKPHKAIHALADRTLELSARGHNAEAIALIQEARETTLTSLIASFADLSQQLEHALREVALVIAHGGKCCAVTVDGVRAVEELHSDFQPLEGMFPDTVIERILCVGRRKEDGKPLLIPDVPMLLNAL